MTLPVRPTLRAAVLTALLTASAVSLAPSASADTVDAICMRVDPEPCAAAQCENAWQNGPGVVAQTKYFIGEEAVIACEAATAQPVVVWLVVAGTCTNTLHYLTGGHCDTSSMGPYQPGPMTCQQPGPAGPGTFGATAHYAAVEAYIVCLALSMEGGVGQDVVVGTCNNASNYLFGRDMCFVI